MNNHKGGKQMKRFLATLLTSMIAITTIAGCAAVPAAAPAASEAVAEEAEKAEEAAPVEEAAPAEETAEAAETTEAAEEAAPEDVVEINVVLCDIPGVADNAQVIVDKMNEITEKTIGVKANITFAALGDYGKQLGLLLAAGEPIDLATNIPMEPATVATLYANGQLKDMTEYLDEYGTDLLDVVGDFTDAYAIEGGIYGVPTFRNYGSSVYLIMRKDILDQLGLTEKAENATTWAEIEEIYAEVKANTDVTPIGGQQIISNAPGSALCGDAFSDAIAFDALSDTMYCVYTDDNGNVSLLPENEQYRQMLDRFKNWYDEGYVYKDSLVTTDHVDILTKSGVVFSSIQVSEIGVEVAKQNTTGYEMIVKELVKNVLGSSFVAKFGTVMPITSQEPEAAVKWLNALYTSPELMNLLDWGEEGVDYAVKDGEGVFVDGQDVNSVRYHNKDYVYGNYFLALPWEGQGADFREISRENLSTYSPSPYLGFTPNLAGLENAIAALNSVYMEYHPDIFCGNFDDAKYDAYVAKLKAAGVDEYLGAYQEQLDAWAAAK